MLTAFNPDWIKDNTSPDKYVTFKCRSYPKHRSLMPIHGDIHRFIEIYHVHYNKKKECFVFNDCYGVSWESTWTEFLEFLEKEQTECVIGIEYTSTL